MNEYGVNGSIGECEEGLIILDHLTKYYEGHKDFWNVFLVLLLRYLDR